MEQKTSASFRGPALLPAPGEKPASLKQLGPDHPPRTPGPPLPLQPSAHPTEENLRVDSKPGEGLLPS